MSRPSGLAEGCVVLVQATIGGGLGERNEVVAQIVEVLTEPDPDDD